MSGTPMATSVLLRESLTAVREMQLHAPLVRAYDLLQERDENGNSLGTRPYTDAALAEFQTAYDRSPDDVGVLHHLAIAHHARAWDMELRRDPRASEEWETAMGLWRRLASSAEFWERLAAKLRACDPNAETGVLRAVRRDLPEALLDIHVAFVRHYCECRELDRAALHIRAVKRAALQPAVRKGLVAKVFHEMVGSMQKARDDGAYESSLTVIERFLELFPDTPFLPAFRLYAELATVWLKNLSYKTDWETIQGLDARARPVARSMAAVPDLERHPLSRTAFEELTGNMGYTLWDRATNIMARNELSESTEMREDVEATLALASEWFRMGYAASRPGTTVRRQLPTCLFNHVQCLFAEIVAVRDSDLDSDTIDETCRNLCLRAMSEIDEAMARNPGEELNEVLVRQREKAVAALRTYSGCEEDALPAVSLPAPSPRSAGARQRTAVEENLAPPDTSVASIWKRGLRTENPYATVAFRIADVPPSVTRYRTLVQLIGRTRAAIGANPGSRTLDGRALTLEDLNRAETILLNPPERILEELLTHAEEAMPLTRIEELMRQTGERLGAAGPARVDRGSLAKICFANAWSGYLEERADPEPVLGSLELELVPPFGGNPKE